MIEPSKVEELIKAALPDADVEVSDLTGTKDHFQARVVSGAFEGKTPIQQHQLVYQALGDAMHGPIHALALKTYTPAAWGKASG